MSDTVIGRIESWRGGQTDPVVRSNTGVGPGNVVIIILGRCEILIGRLKLWDLLILYFTIGIKERFLFSEIQKRLTSS